MRFSRFDAETKRHGALCTPGNPITCAVRTPPQAPRGGVHLFFPAPCRTGIPPWRIEIWQQSGRCHLDLNGHPTLPLWLMIAGSIGHSSVGSGVAGWPVRWGRKAARRSRNTCRSSPKYLPVSPTHSMPLRRTVDAALVLPGRAPRGRRRASGSPPWILTTPIPHRCSRAGGAAAPPTAAPMWCSSAMAAPPPSVSRGRNPPQRAVDRGRTPGQRRCQGIRRRAAAAGQLRPRPASAVRGVAGFQ